MIIIQKREYYVLADESHFSISELENLEQEMGLVDRPFALLIVRRLSWGKNGSVIKNAKKLNSLTNDMVLNLRSRFETQSNLGEDILREKIIVSIRFSLRTVECVVLS